MKTQKEIIVITGAAGGIGLACARAFKNESIIITDYAQAVVDKTVQTLKNDGFNVTGIACDITNKNDVEKLTEFVAKHGSFKALIHTAGVSGTVKDIKKVYTIDLVATEILIDAFYDLATKNSVAILLSSMMAHTIVANEAYDDALKTLKRKHPLKP